MAPATAAAPSKILNVLFMGDYPRLAQASLPRLSEDASSHLKGIFRGLYNSAMCAPRIRRLSLEVEAARRRQIAGLSEQSGLKAGKRLNRATFDRSHKITFATFAVSGCILQIVDDRLPPVRIAGFRQSRRQEVPDDTDDHAAAAAHARRHEAAQHGRQHAPIYVRSVAGFSAYHGRSPDQLTLEDVRDYQLHLVARGLKASSICPIMPAGSTRPAINRPNVSTRIWRLRPFTRLCSECLEHGSMPCLSGKDHQWLSLAGHPGRGTNLDQRSRGRRPSPRCCPGRGSRHGGRPACGGDPGRGR